MYMEQLSLPMLTVYSGPRLVDQAEVAKCRSYREAVRLCWEQRTRINLKRIQVAEYCGLYASHVTDYFSASPSRRELPAKKVDVVERVLGNRAISQWLLLQTQRSDAEVTELREAA
jgi:hypothetical protein